MTIVECPQCGKRCIVHEGTLYVCLDLTCNFRRNIAQPKPETSPQFPFVDLLWIVISGIVIVLTLQYLLIPNRNIEPATGVGFLPELECQSQKRSQLSGAIACKR